MFIGMYGDSVLPEMAAEAKHLRDHLKCVPSAEFVGKPPAECLNEWWSTKAWPESSIPWCHPGSDIII